MNETPQLRQSCIDHGLPKHCGGEPSIGVNPATNNAVVQMMLTTARVHWDDTRRPARATWTNVSYHGFVSTADPVLATDHATGRTFQVQLCPDVPCQATTGIVTTDDDGSTWNQPARVVSPFPDKPVIGSGNYHLPVPPGVAYPRAVYLCITDGFQSDADVYCHRSDDGGLTWGSPRAVPTGSASCLPYVGEIEVDDVGVVYLPIAHCHGHQGMAISDDNGETWRVIQVPRVPDGGDNFDQFPDVASDRAGRLYYAASSKGRPVVATSTDHGRTWTAPVDVALASGVRFAQFPTVVAGDDGRAAMAFLGTTTKGFPETPDWDGFWRLYVAITLDGGTTWHLTDVTRADPVQRGCIGSVFMGTCPRRNLLDFIDSAIDTHGRVLVAYTDGCVSEACVGPNGTPADSNDSTYAVARQVTGPRMFAAGDAP